MQDKQPPGPDVYLEKVGLTLGGTTILQDINLTFTAGTIHCIIGPNGGGKTSLIRSLLGQMPNTGRIAIDWKQNSITGYVPQTLHFEPTLPITVENFMAMISSDRPAFAGIGEKEKAIIDQALARVSMQGKRRNRFGSLSGGERQRVLFAQALIPEPALVVLDEPMTGLDKSGIAIIEKLVLELREQGKTIVWIHHDLEQVGRVADSVTCINREVVFSGSPAEVLVPENILALFSHHPSDSSPQQAAAG